ncbi:MAG: endonuclease/exonuclease/phosphatase family protein [Fulvimarina manganoxydans]|uniref:endonuclease/exonuclease/phosphatase family protein n=1 Tax=Fulvimarina manganoxydans TaxID=937218 RepID=UPI002353EAF9|nr:endonuclease/exonuclease/phosphatase family protein [Fulvimarina manganoxydans]MCK5930687.1 endonuclease/exonuclease/phosphatase family protein [Fulvimarina manganoxydans]
MTEGGGTDERVLRIMSWNCHGAIGEARKPDPERVITEIARLRPDILALQEVDGRAYLGRKKRAFEFFADRLPDLFAPKDSRGERHLVEARTIRRKDQDHGHLLWSRFPIRGADVVRLPGPMIEDRLLIDAVIETPLGALRVFSSHFALFPPTRLRQARAIVERIGLDRQRPTLALGDLNEWSSTGWVHRTLVAALPKTFAPKSWPSKRPRFALDRLYASSDVELVGGWTDAEAGRASDHRPIIVDLMLREDEGPIG